MMECRGKENVGVRAQTGKTGPGCSVDFPPGGDRRYADSPIRVIVAGMAVAVIMPQTGREFELAESLSVDPQ